MKEYQWPYSCINKEEYLAKIVFVEKILQKYGAEYIEDFCETCTWSIRDGSYACEKVKKHVWKREDEYIRVDRVYFSEKPFLVLEFSKCKEGPYEDADPFPYDLPDNQMEQEIRFSLGLEAV